MSAIASALKQQAVRSPARRRSPRGAFHRMTDRQTLGRRGVINFITHEHRVTAQDVPDDPGAYSVRPRPRKRGTGMRYALPNVIHSPGSAARRGVADDALPDSYD